MKHYSYLFFYYGAFLIVMGLLGYLSNPEGAKTALLSGGLFGSLSLVIGWLGLKGWKRARQAGIGLALMLGAAFTWRASVSWAAVSDGLSEKLVAAILITTMLVATLAFLVILLRQIFGQNQSPQMAEN